MCSWVLSWWGGSHVPCICEAAVWFPLCKVIALLCALNSIHYITKLMRGCFVLGVDQSLSYGPAWFKVNSNFFILKDSSELFTIDLQHMGWPRSSIFQFLPRVVLCGTFWTIWQRSTLGDHMSGALFQCVSVPFVFPLMEEAFWAWSCSIRVTPSLCSSGMCLIPTTHSFFCFCPES